MSMLKFNKKKQPKVEVASSDPYKVLIVDDEQDVHLLTKSVLKDFTLDGRSLEFIDAYSAREAREVMRQHPDVALVLLDVVMEEDDSGLKVARFIREELCNHFVRIVLRTGQPGQAPEEDVIVGYDINDYKEKTELTSKKLFTLMYSGLRAYRDIIELERNRSYVHTLLDATGLVLGAVSEDGRILNITASIEKLTNYRPDELHERQIWDLMALPEEAEEMKAALESPHQPAVGLHSKLFTGHLNMKAGGWRLVKWTNTALSLNGEAGFAILFVSAPSNSLAEEEPQP